MSYRSDTNSAVTPLSFADGSDRPDPLEPPARAAPEADPGVEAPRQTASDSDQPAPQDLPDPAKARRLANLLPGGNASIVAARAAKLAKEAERQAMELERLDRLKTKEGVLDELRRRVIADTGDSAFVASCKALLDAYGEASADRAVRRIPRSVMDWLDKIEEYEGPVVVVEPDGSTTKPPEGGNGKDVS